MTINGLFTLRKGSEEVALRFYEEYKEFIDSYKINFLIILLSASFCLFVS